MQEIFDPNHDDDFTYQDQEYIHVTNHDESEPAGRSCRHCGCDIPSESAVCPECGRWWTNPAS